MKRDKESTRRDILRMGAALGGGLIAGRQDVLGLERPGKLGTPLGPYGERSPFEKAVRWRRDSRTPETGSSFTPTSLSKSESGTPVHSLQLTRP